MPDTAQAALVVAGARGLFIEKGYGGTTMDDIAARCRVSKRTLYHLFPGKTDLFAAIVDAHRHSMLALPGDYDHLSLQAALEAIFRVDIDDAAHAERMALLRLVMVEAGQFPELGRLIREHGGDRSRGLLADWLERQRSAGRIDTDDSRSAAKMLMDMMFGAIMLRTAEAETQPPRHTHGATAWPSRQERDAHLRRCIRVFLRGLAPGAPP